MRFCFLLSFLIARAAAGGTLEALPEYLRPDPFGSIVSVDRSAEPALFLQQVRLRVARGGYASCHLVVKLPEKGAYALNLEPERPAAGVEAHLYREWFHFTAADKQYFPEALVPVRTPHKASIPDPDNRIESQTAQAFWLDLWAAPDAKPGQHRFRAVLESGGKTANLLVHLEVLPAVIPDEDPVVMDHNSYGASWLGDYFPAVRQREGAQFYSSDAFFRLIYSYHRIFYEHSAA